jgi:hypothetical protein
MPVATGNGGLPTVQLRAADGSATAELYQHGATLTSWAVGGEERIFVSPNAVFAPPKAIRGGVPVCWPQFAMLGPLKVGPCPAVLPPFLPGAWRRCCARRASCGHRCCMPSPCRPSMALHVTWSGGWASWQTTAALWPWPPALRRCRSGPTTLS